MKQKSIPQLFDLTGKNAIVTGGSMGIGFGLDALFLENHLQTCYKHRSARQEEKVVRELLDLCTK